MSILVTRGEEVKLKCNYNKNYNTCVRGGEEHRNLRKVVWFTDKWGSKSW